MKKWKDLPTDKSCKDKLFEGDTFIYSKRLLIKVVRKFAIFPKECPHCKSKKTYHTIANIQHNVWRIKTDYMGRAEIFKKFDFCFDCHKEFLLEAYVYEYSRRKKWFSSSKEK